MDIRKAYEVYDERSYGKKWTKENIAEGFVGDVGDLMKLILAKQGIREIDKVNDKLAHELSDCLWSIIVLAELYEVDLESSFIRTMNGLEANIKNGISQI